LGGKRIIKIAAFGLFVLICVFVSHNNNHLYSTWDNLEVDKCASAWLLVTFGDSKAVFRFYPEGGLINEGIPFDTPDSQFRRTHNKTSFEAVRDAFKVNDPIIKQMADIIRDIELNIWGRKKYRVSDEINSKINQIIRNSTSTEEALKDSYKIFSSLYDELKAGKLNKQEMN